MPVPNFTEFLAKRRSMQFSDDANQLDQQQPRTVATKHYELPKIDTSDVIGSLAGMLGPTPEEREQQEQQLMEHKRKMHGWTALFNGLRHLSNLYFTTKGAAPQKFSDPHQQIEQQYQDEKKRLDDMNAATQKYYAGLWGLQRQVSDEKRRNLIANAQATYYGTRDEAARQKAEIDQQKAELERLKAVRVIKQKDGSLLKFDPVTGETEQLTETDPLYIEYKRSQINKNNRTGTGGSRGGGRRDGSYTKERWTDDNGHTWEKRVDGRGANTHEVKKTGGKGAVGAKPSGSSQQRNGVRKSRTQL